MAVAALSDPTSVAGYSTRGAYVDVAAPGSNIYSTKRNSTWGNNSGTSMAAPHVSGLAALIIAGRGWISPADMLSRLTRTATDGGAPCFDNAFGWGIVDPVAAMNTP